MLSIGGSEVFIKSILQAIPTFAMTWFLLPKSFCKEMEALFARFWWQKPGDRKCLHWCERSALCNLKSDEGMGFRDMAKFNIALLAKQGWRILVQPTSLVRRILRAKYFSHSNFLSAQLGSNPSFIWSAHRLLKMGLRWKVGNGRLIRIWDDRWMLGGGLGVLVRLV